MTRYFVDYIKITDDILYEFSLRSLVRIMFTVLGLYRYSFTSYVRKKNNKNCNYRICYGLLD